MAIDVNIPSQVKNYANLAAFPVTGTLKTIFIAEDTNKTYRWTGSVYVEISGVDLSGYVPTSRTLTINGTTQDLSANRTFTVSTGITIGTTAITSGTVGRVLFEGAGNVVQESANLVFDNGRLGVGLNNPQGATHIAVATGTPAIVLSDVGSPNNIPTVQFRRGPLLAYSLQIDFPSNNKARFQIGDAVTGYELTGGNVGLTGGRSIEFGGITGQIATGIIGSIQTDNNNGQLTFSTRGSGTTAERMRIFNTGNIGINTTTDAGFKLDVNGTARVQGNAQFGTSFYWDNSNQRIGVRTSTPGAGVDVWNSPSENPQYRISHSGVTIPNYSGFNFSPILSSNTLGYFSPWSGASGGVQFAGFTSNTNSGQPFVFIGYHGGTSPTTPSLLFLGFKHDGNNNRTALTANEIIASFRTGSNPDVLQVKANGRINMSSLPTSPTGLSAGDIWNNLGILNIV